MERFYCTTRLVTDESLGKVIASDVRSAAIAYARRALQAEPIEPFEVLVRDHLGNIHTVMVRVSLEFEARIKEFVDPISQPLFSDDGRVDHDPRGEAAVRADRRKDEAAPKRREAAPGDGLLPLWAQGHPARKGRRAGRGAQEGGG